MWCRVTWNVVTTLSLVTTPSSRPVRARLDHRETILRWLIYLLTTYLVLLCMSSLTVLGSPHTHAPAVGKDRSSWGPYRTSLSPPPLRRDPKDRPRVTRTSLTSRGPAPIHLVPAPRLRVPCPRILRTHRLVPRMDRGDSSTGERDGHG